MKVLVLFYSTYGGASTIAGGGGERLPSANELDGARYQGRHLAQIVKKLSA